MPEWRGRQSSIPPSISSKLARRIKEIAVLLASAIRWFFCAGSLRVHHVLLALMYSGVDCGQFGIVLFLPDLHLTCRPLALFVAWKPPLMPILPLAVVPPLIRNRVMFTVVRIVYQVSCSDLY